MYNTLLAAVARSSAVEVPGPERRLRRERQRGRAHLLLGPRGCEARARAPRAQARRPARRGRDGPEEIALPRFSVSHQ